MPEVFAEQYRKMMQEHIETLTTKFSESRIDYVQLNTSQAARRGVVHVPRQSRAADAGAVGRMSFLAPLLLRRARRDRRSDPRAPDPARAEERRRVSVADVHPADSVSVGGAAPDSQLARCCCCASPRCCSSSRRSRGRSSASIRCRPQAASSGAREVVILLDRSASMGYGDHWARAKDEARKVRRQPRRRRPRHARAVRHGPEETVRATADTGRGSRRPSTPRSSAPTRRATHRRCASRRAC